MPKSMKDVDEKYICPQKAAHKFRSAGKLRTPLYLYGVTGIGKTSLVRNRLRKNIIYITVQKRQMQSRLK